MIELGELEKHHDEFARRRVRVLAISNDDQQAAKATQADFPHLVIVADTQQNLAKAVEVIHAGAGATGDDTNAPTTILVDGAGTIRWVARPERVLSRLAPAEVLQGIDRNLSKP